MITALIQKETFDTLSNAEKRVAICNDVLARIAASVIFPVHSTFWNLDDIYKGDSTPQEKVNSHCCKVCAKGALFCSWVGNFNKVGWDDMAGAYLEEVDELNDVVPELVNIFGRKMLDNIEAAFERQAYSWHYDEYEVDKYAKAFKGCSLKSIMQYIVDNKGEFPLPE